MDKYSYIIELYKEIKNELNLYDDYVSEYLIKKIIELYSLVQNNSGGIDEKIVVLMLENIDKKRPYISTFIYSFLINLKPDPILMQQFEEYILFYTKWKPNTKYFLFYQLQACMFLNYKLENKKNRTLLLNLFRDIVNDFRKLINVNLKKIPIEQRDTDLVIVIAGQILSPRHAPTMITMERCRILKKSLGKKVLLINTAESESMMGAITFFKNREANYLDRLKEVKELDWKETKIDYIQCENRMPSIDTLEVFLSYIQKVKPYFILSLGGSSILANLANYIVPVLVEDFSAKLSITTANYQVVSYEMIEEDKELLQEQQIDTNSLIKSQLLLTIPEQKRKITKIELGLPKDKFILITMGNRLNVEVTEEFIHVLEEVLDDNTIMVFCGKFEMYEEFINKYFKLREKIYYIGRTDDILAVLENCDLYVNMIRSGGGTSGTAALYKGVPVVTTSYGDIASNAGEDFITASYETMIDLIKKYKEDKIFYDKQVIKAKKRAEQLLNKADERYIAIIKEFEKRFSLQETKND